MANRPKNTQAAIKFTRDLKSWMSLMNYTQEQAAKELNVSVRSVARWMLSLHAPHAIVEVSVRHKMDETSNKRLTLDELIDNSRKRKLKIVIEGDMGTGKTSMAAVIERFLKENNIPTTRHDPDPDGRSLHQSTTASAVMLAKLGSSQFYANIEVEVRCSGKLSPEMQAYSDRSRLESENKKGA